MPLFLLVLLGISVCYSLPDLRNWDFRRMPDGVWRPTNPHVVHALDVVNATHARAVAPGFSRQSTEILVNERPQTEPKFYEVCHAGAAGKHFDWGVLEDQICTGQLCGTVVLVDGQEPEKMQTSCVPWLGGFKASTQDWFMFYGARQLVKAGVSYILDPSPPNSDGRSQCYILANEWNFAAQVRGWITATATSVQSWMLGLFGITTFAGDVTDVGMCAHHVALSEIAINCRVSPTGKPSFWWRGAQFQQQLVLPDGTALVLLGTIDAFNPTSATGTNCHPAHTNPTLWDVPPECYSTQAKYCAGQLDSTAPGTS